MAIFRKIHTSFWSDSFVSELENDQKLFYLYLMTNERTRQCGVYEITKKQIAFDLGYSIDKVSKLLAYFISKKKIKYNDKTNELALGNWLKYNNSTSPKVQSCINQEFKLVKDTVLIEYVKSIDTQSQEEQEEEEEKEPEEEVYKKFKHLSITVNEFNKLLVSGYTKDEVDQILNKIENFKNNKKYVSLYLTALDWLKKEREWSNGKTQPPKPVQNPVSGGYQKLKEQGINDFYP